MGTLTYKMMTQAWNPYFNNNNNKFFFLLLLNTFYYDSSTIMKTEPSYILQHSLLTREVFINETCIYKYKEDLKAQELWRTSAHKVKWTRFLTKKIYPDGTKMD